VTTHGDSTAGGGGGGVRNFYNRDDILHKIETEKILTVIKNLYINKYNINIWF